MYKLYAFKNRRNGKYITGTDFGYYPHHQIMSISRRPLLVCDENFDGIFIRTEIAHRMINLKTYKIVEVEIKEVKNG